MGLSFNTCPGCLLGMCPGPGAKQPIARLGGRPWPLTLMPSCHLSFCAWQPFSGQGPSRSPDLLFLGGRESCLPLQGCSGLTQKGLARLLKLYLHYPSQHPSPTGPLLRCGSHLLGRAGCYFHPLSSWGLAASIDGIRVLSGPWRGCYGNRSLVYHLGGGVYLPSPGDGAPYPSCSLVHWGLCLDVHGSAWAPLVPPWGWRPHCHCPALWLQERWGMCWSLVSWTEQKQVQSPPGPLLVALLALAATGGTWHLLPAQLQTSMSGRWGPSGSLWRGVHRQ